MSKRISIKQGICNGRQVIRGTSVTVQTVLEFLAAGDSVGDVLGVSKAQPGGRASVPRLRFALNGQPLFSGSSGVKGYLFICSTATCSRAYGSHRSFRLFLYPKSDETQRTRRSGISPAHDLVIVSKDTDFSERIITSSSPPRVAHLRFGNLRRSEYHAITYPALATY